MDPTPLNSETLPLPACRPKFIISGAFRKAKCDPRLPMHAALDECERKRKLVVWVVSRLWLDQSPIREAAICVPTQR